MFTITIITNAIMPIISATAIAMHDDRYTPAYNPIDELRL